MIHFTGLWDVPYNGSSGSDAQFATLDECSEFQLEQQFDEASVMIEESGQLAKLDEQDGVWGWRFTDHGDMFVSLEQ